MNCPKCGNIYIYEIGYDIMECPECLYHWKIDNLKSFIGVKE